MRRWGTAPRLPVAACGAILVLAACSGGATESDLALTLEPSGAVVTVTLTNNTSETALVVRPTETPNFVLFVVADSAGEQVPYLGTYPQLKPLTDDGFATLAPGEATSATFDLQELFGLEQGRFSVEAEYRNPARGSHEGAAAVVFEPGEGPTAVATIEVP